MVTGQAMNSPEIKSQRQQNVLNYKFIVNPAAGQKNADQIIDSIKEVFAFSNSSFDFHVTTGPGNAISVAEYAAQNGADVVVAVGGDGTVNEVVNGLADNDAVLGVIPTGTGNDFAQAVDMPFEVKKASKQLLRGMTRTIDLGKVGDRLFINLVGVGFDGAVANLTNKNGKRVQGSLMYLISVLRTLFTYKTVPMKITLDDQSFETNPMLVAVGIGPSYGGGINIVPQAVQDDGYFDVCVIDSISKPVGLYYLAQALRGNHEKLKKTNIYRSSYVKLESAKEIPFHVEGEVFYSDEIEFTITPREIEVITG